MKKLSLILLLICFQSIFVQAEEYILKVKDPEKVYNILNSFLNNDVKIRKFINFDKNKILFSNASSNQLINQLDKYFILTLNNDNIIYILNILKNNYQITNITPNYNYKLDILSDINDEKLKFQYALNEIRAFEAWKFASGKDIIIGVIDTGIDFNHPDLQKNLWINSKEDINKNGTFEPWLSTEVRNGISGDLNGIDEDGNGFADDVIGYDFVNQKIPNIGDWKDYDPVPYDEYDHGTAISGVIAAEQNNNIGISGLAFNSKILSCRVFDITGNATASDIASAIIYATLNGAKILNFSFGEKYSSPLMHDAIKFAHSLGVIMVASAGNDGNDRPHYPSDYPEVISVGGSAPDGKRWSHSNFGNNLCLLAPAQSIITTTPNKSYGLKSGTSISAPYVSASIALMLEVNPNLQLEDVKSILTTTARSVDPDGWNYFTGAGILDVAAALENIHYGELKLYSPIAYEPVNKNKIKLLPIIGSIITPLFDYYQVLIGKGKNPSIWDTLSNKLYTAKLKDTIFNIDLTQFKDTIYTINILINLKNQKKLQLRTQIQIYSDNNPFFISNFKWNETLYNDKNVITVYFSTNFDAFSQIFYRKKNSNNRYGILTDNIEKSQNHFYLIEDLEYDEEYEAIALAYINNNDTAFYSFSFKCSELNFPKYSFQKKNYTLPRALIFPKVTDINKNSKPEVFFNDISNLVIKNSYVAEFDGEKFTIIDSLQQNGIVTGIGNYNGNDKKDILIYGNGNSMILEQSLSPNKIFGNKIFDSQSLNFWAEHFYDINLDGRDEIIAHNDSSFFAYSQINGKDVLIAQTTLPKELRNIGLWRGSALGDFNNNGKVNLYHSNNKGHSFIFEYNKNKFDLIYSDISINASENQYITRADIDSDGIDEIIHLSYGIFPRRNDPADGLWYIRVIKHSQEKGFYIADSLYIYGIRAGVISKIGASYRNGVAAGNLDNIPGDEIIISTMPNLYVFRWNKTKQKLEPIWFYPTSFTNSAFCFDFDGNGKIEIGFATFDNTEFWELVAYPKINEPRLKGYALNANTVKLFWDKVKNASRYNCYLLDESTQTLKFIKSTEDNFVILDNLKANKYHIFFINAENDFEFSNLSNDVRIYTNDLAQANYFDILSENIIIVHYNSILKQGRIEPTNFELINLDSGIIYDFSSAQALVNKVYLTTYDKITSGRYELICKPIYDEYNNLTVQSEITSNFKFTTQNDPPLFLTRLRYFTNNYIQIEFSEPPDSSALKVDNYSISPFGKIIGVNRIPGDGRLFELALSREFPIKPKGNIFYITAKNIKTSTGKSITQGAGNTLAFVISAKNLRNCYVFPHPISFKNDEFVTIAGLTARATIEIFTIDGEKLNTIYEIDANGGTCWNLRDSLGNKIKPGVYIIKVTNTDFPDEDFEIKKILVKP